MKIPSVLEILLITALVAFASAKSVDRRIAREESMLEATTAKLNISSLLETTTAKLNVGNSVRQDVVSQDIQIVQELTDSQEQAALVGEQSDATVTDAKLVSVENNEVEQKPTADKPLNENDPNPINKYCSCSSASCKCCRDFSIPLIPIRGPGCATVRYLDNDRLSIGIKYGDLVLASRTVDSRRPTPYNMLCCWLDTTAHITWRFRLP